MASENDCIDVEYDSICFEDEHKIGFTIENERIFFTKGQCGVDPHCNTISLPKWLARKKDLFFD